jgi:hypothetical protein
MRGKTMYPIFQKKIPVILLVIRYRLGPEFVIYVGISSLMNRILNAAGAPAPEGV